MDNVFEAMRIARGLVGKRLPEWMMEIMPVRLQEDGALDKVRHLTEHRIKALAKTPEWPSDLSVPDITVSVKPFTGQADVLFTFRYEATSFLASINIDASMFYREPTDSWHSKYPKYEPPAKLDLRRINAPWYTKK